LGENAPGGTCGSRCRPKIWLWCFLLSVLLFETLATSLNDLQWLFAGNTFRPNIIKFK